MKRWGPLASSYIDAKARVTDKVERMRLDEDWREEVTRLRDEGKIPSARDIRGVADRMADLEPVAMRKALRVFSEGVAERPQNQF